MRCLSLSGQSWAKKTGIFIFILGTLIKMTVAKTRKEIINSWFKSRDISPTCTLSCHTLATSGDIVASVIPLNNVYIYTSVVDPKSCLVKFNMTFLRRNLSFKLNTDNKCLIKVNRIQPISINQSNNRF